MTLRLRILFWTLVAPRVMRKGPREAFRSFTPRAFSITPAAAHKETSPEEIDRLIAMADDILLASLFGKLIFRTRCFKRSLVLFRLLRSHGHDARAHVGFSKEGSTLTGHAWVTINGERISEPFVQTNETFTPFYEFGKSERILRGA